MGTLEWASRWMSLHFPGGMQDNILCTNRPSGLPHSILTSEPDFSRAPYLARRRLSQPMSQIADRAEFLVVTECENPPLHWEARVPGVYNSQRIFHFLSSVSIEALPCVIFNFHHDINIFSALQVLLYIITVLNIFINYNPVRARSCELNICVGHGLFRRHFL